MKDTVIILLIIIAVICGNIISQHMLKSDSGKIVEKLDTLKQELTSENAKELAEEIYSMWEETEKRWSKIVLHQELDNIKTAIIAVKSGIESEDFSFSYQQINNSIFLLEHQTEKWALKWKNIF